MTLQKSQIIIIGNGIAGVTCARHIRKNSDDDITIISGETDHFFSRTALMYIYMGHMKYEHTKPYEDWFWEKNRINLKRAWVKSLNTAEKQLNLQDGTVINYTKLVLATGSKPNKFGWPGQDLKGVQGLYSYQDLELLEANTHPPKSSKKTVERAVIVGGGLIGVELAEMLFTRNIQVTFLVREDRFWGNVLPEQEGKMIAEHMKKHHVDLRFETELKEIISDENGRAKAVITSKGETIDCQLVGLTAGVSPNVDFLKASELGINRGILVNEFLETSVEDVFAIGDCTEFENPPAGARRFNQVWYTGRMMGETLAQTLTVTKTAYRPGPWFNSAKFFDIEYQTYGDVDAHPADHVKTFYWQKDERAIHIQFDQLSLQFLGINTFGIRMRHECFDTWLKAKASVNEVLKGLAKANFDPEFYRAFESEIVDQWNKEHPTNTVQIKKRFLVF
jgi:NADPH-dependent 2,4-dienoyl-CoA reductase/sulfur reductase-like enzyme